ncbi:hypothetical protein EAH_00004370 [Eimeria acervulina]|uniref:Uncharacterized protein n=1 Tax=Eimeria acervulina TaxID=5801 RepID=U6GF12_EIMAC|nr:hypothetical protein EAH_00004370 [Eimeria acervulina]CDI77144.1 hypothetical protein EAH_00004370 [Eimeria acervulina]
MHLSHLTLETDKKIYIGTFASDTTGGGAETLCELRSRHSDFFVSKVLMQDEAFGSGRTQNVAPRAANKSADAVSMKHHGSKRDAATKAANDIPNIGPPANSRHAMFKDGRTAGCQKSLLLNCRNEGVACVRRAVEVK